MADTHENQAPLHEDPAGKEKTPQQVIKDKLTEKRKELGEQIQEAFDDATRTNKVGEVAYVEGSKNLPRQQLRILDQIFDRRQKEIDVATGGQLDQLFNEIVKEAQDHANMVTSMINIVAGKDGDKILSETEIHELGLMLKQSTEIAKKNPELNAIVQKLNERKNLQHEGEDEKKWSKLTEDDYRTIINIMDIGRMQKSTLEKPADLSSADVLTESTIGTILALMDPAEKVELITIMMDSDKADDVPDVIDFLTRNNILTLPQAEHLFQLARQNNILDDRELEMFEKKFDQEYPDAQNKIQEAAAKAVKNLEGQFAINELDRFFGMPMIGYAMKIHSIMWLFAIIMVKHADIKEILTNPYTIAAVGELIASHGITKYGGIVGAKYGGIAGIINEYFGDDGGPNNKEEADALNELNTIYSKHLDFADYLKMGGAGHILALQKKNDLENNHKQITYQDLIEEEEKNGTDDQLGALDDSFEFETRHNPANQKVMDELIQKFIESANTLGMVDQASYKSKIDLIEHAQGIKSGTA